MNLWIHLVIQLVIPILVAVYTINFGRHMSKQGYRTGSIGAYLWAFLCVVVPASVAWYNR